MGVANTWGRVDIRRGTKRILALYINDEKKTQWEWIRKDGLIEAMEKAKSEDYALLILVGKVMYSSIAPNVDMGELAERIAKEKKV